VLVSNEVNTGYGDTDPVRRLDPNCRSTEVRTGGDDRSRYEAIVKDFPRTINISEERFKRSYPLGDSSREPVPLECANDSRNEVEREWALLTTVSERYASFDERA
jgi:hypothetical protein